MRPRPVGGAAAGAGVPEEQKPGAWEHPERQAGFEKHDQLFLRPTDRVSHLRISADHLLLQLAPPAGTHPGRPHQHREYPKLCGQHLAQVCCSLEFIVVLAEAQIFDVFMSTFCCLPGYGKAAAPAATAGGISRIQMRGGCPVAVGTGQEETLSRARCRRAGTLDTPPPTRTSPTVWVRTSDTESNESH